VSNCTHYAFVRPTKGKLKSFRWRAVLGCGLLISTELWAQSPNSAVHAAATPRGALASPALFEGRGRWTFGTQLGFAFENAIPQNISHIALVIAQPQVGFRVKDFDSRRFPLRRVEILNEGILGGAVHPKARLTGYGFLFRLEGKNRARFVPFFDVGVGIQNTTLYTRAPEVSGALQFSPQGGPGIEWFLGPQRALVFQYRYLHMSNAGIQLPNLGFNANMVSIGFRWSRRPRSLGGRPSHLSLNAFRHKG
jgi:lipid A 3-O-deacylase PagL